MSAIGKRLKTARESAGLSQTVAASRVGLSAAAISAYEQGSRAPNEMQLHALATLYGVPAPVLRYGEAALKAASNTLAAERLRKAADALLETAKEMDPALSPAAVPDVVSDAEQQRAIDEAMRSAAGAGGRTANKSPKRRQRRA